ncbi:MAG: hypothetical protein OXH99_24100 [Bryobacterales bacterium]|nr:hypothetical protein [Bryobacterales bacterium]
MDHARRLIVMHFHGSESLGRRTTRVALSKDGIDFQARPEILGRTHLRNFLHGGRTYAIAMPGRVRRSRPEDGLSDFEEGPLPFNPDMFHWALLKRGGILHVSSTQIRHAPERTLLSAIDLSLPLDQ